MQYWYPMYLMFGIENKTKKIYKELILILIINQLKDASACVYLSNLHSRLQYMINS